VITRDLRHAIARAAASAGSRQAEDPGLRPTGVPGQYAASIALALGGNPRETAQNLAARLAGERWIDMTEVTGPGYLTITVTPAALAAVADSVTAAGPACVTSDALAGVTVPAPPPGDPLTSATWEEARAALAARLTARLAAAAGASVFEAPGGEAGAMHGQETDVARAIAFAGRDAVMFTLARAIPGKPLRVDPEIIARHVLSNPAYAVRYAHARAASGVRWGAISSAADTIGSGETPQFPLVGSGPELVVPEAGADKMAVCAIGSGLRNSGGSNTPILHPAGEAAHQLRAKLEYSLGGSPPRETTALLDALSWLPERVATAARRGRPDEFARYLEDLARITIDALSSASHPGSNAAPGSDRLTVAMAARTGLAAGLGLLEVAASERL
jgi:arginyl-tRNA synthetase